MSPVALRPFLAEGLPFSSVPNTEATKLHGCEMRYKDGLRICYRLSGQGVEPDPLSRTPNLR